MTISWSGKAATACIIFGAALLVTQSADGRPAVGARGDGAREDASQAEGVSAGRQENVNAEMGELTAQDRLILRLTREASSAVGKTMEKWVNEKKVSKEKLFSFLYYPIQDTDPQKFHTDYDSYSDQDILPIQEKFLAADSSIVFVVTVDKNGYLPTHNTKYSKPLTGHKSIDLTSNRTKRIFNDRTGLRAGRSKADYLLQEYKRDTGENMKDLSVPIMVFGQHWGGIRFGYVSKD